MFRRFIPFVVLLALAGAPSTVHSATVDIATQVGASNAWLSGYQPSSTGVYRGVLTVGVVQPLGRIFALDVELGMVGRGADIGLFDIYDTHDRYYGVYTVHLETDYLHLPALVRFTPIPGRLRPVFVAGVDLSWKTGERYRVEGLPKLEAMARADIRHFDWGAVGGAGLELDTPAGTWTVEGRYTLGMTDMQPTTFGAGPARNRDMQLVLGLRKPWPFGK